MSVEERIRDLDGWVHVLKESEGVIRQDILDLVKGNRELQERLENLEKHLWLVSTREQMRSGPRLLSIEDELERLKDAVERLEAQLRSSRNG